jgi:thiamine-monophosphate kinase
MSVLSEFQLIERYFRRRSRKPGTPFALNSDDDCALIAHAPGRQLAISTDMLIEGRHFFADVDPRALGHKALAVNLSDLAAMGAKPLAFMLALALPDVCERWLSSFSEGLFALADQYHCELIGGDTTVGPRTLCITIVGDIECGQSLTRNTAHIGDDIWVSGTLGDARFALGILRHEWSATTDELSATRHALEWPQPRIALGCALAGVARAAIDLSDGLAGDLAHLVTHSNLAAVINVDTLPRSAVLARQPAAVQQLCTAAGGDDYELCFTARSDTDTRTKITALGEQLGLRMTRIGQMIDFRATDARIIWRNATDTRLPLSLHGYDPFRADQ